MVTLSICIPSYNRFEKLNETISMILESKSLDFDIVIVDNCSPRKIEDFIDCVDDRIKIIHREKAVRGEKSVNECVKYADGKYALLLLDKDVIKGVFIDNLINILRDSEIVGGYCVINSTGNSFEIVKEKPILRFGYLSKHPSGNIYRTEIVNDFIQHESLLIEKNTFGFDYCMGYVASKGPMLYYDKPMVFSQLDKPTGKIDKSLSFNPRNGNVFYLPQNRIDEFKSFAFYLDKLEISEEVKREKLEILYVSTISSVTTAYRKIMRNKYTCYHYGHNTKWVSVFEMINNYKNVNKALYETELSYISSSEKKNMKKKILKYVPKKIFTKIFKR